MARKMRKFSDGGAMGKYARRMADIKKDFAKDSAGKSGRALEVLEAKRAQRTADAEDDRAKRTGADRTATRAAERAAESNLTKTRKYGAPQSVTKDTAGPTGKVTDTLGALTAPKSDSSIGKPKSFGAAFKDARSRLGAGKTFTFNGKSFTTNIAGEGRKAADTAPTKVQRNYTVTPENRKAIDAAAKKEPFSKFDKAALSDLKTGKNSYGAASIGKAAAKNPPAAAAKNPPAAAAKNPPAAAAKPKESAASLASKAAAERARVAKLTGNEGRRARFADMLGFGSADAIDSRANAAKMRERIAQEQAGRVRAQAVKNQQRAASARKEDFINRKVEGETGWQRIQRINEETAAKAKGGKVKKEKTMKYRSGGSTPPQPSAADRKADAKFRESLKKEKVTPEQAAAIGRANRSEKRFASGGVTKEMPSSKAMGGLGMAKGGKAKAKPAAKAKGNPFAATKFGAAMKKKSADTKGRAMPKFAKGGSIDGCAVRGKTKAKRVVMACSGGKMGGRK